LGEIFLIIDVMSSYSPSLLLELLCDSPTLVDKGMKRGKASETKEKRDIFTRFRYSSEN
jgi:hypothetical protein